MHSTEMRNRKKQQKREAERRKKALERRKRIVVLRFILPLILLIAVVMLLVKACSHFSSNTNSEEDTQDEIVVGEKLEINNEVVAVDNVAQPEIDEQLIPVNEYSRPGKAIVEVQNIIIHYVGNPGTTAQQNRDYFNELSVTGENSVSSNFVVGLDGEIILCVPLDEVAYASNWANSTSISIEVCHEDETGEFSPETYASVVHLTAWLCEEYGLDSEDVLRHYDITGKLCPLYYVQNIDEWETLKSDVADLLNGVTEA